MRTSKKLLSIAAIFCGFIFFSTAVAQNQDAAQGGNGLQISPTRSDISAQPGEVKTFTVSLRNITKGDLIAKASVKDFESDNVSGTPQIVVDDNNRTPNTIKNFLSGAQDVELKANEVKEIKLTLTVPADAAPGAYYGAIVYEASPKKSQNNDDRQVALSASVAHLVLLEVAGDVTEQIQIESLKAQRDNQPKSFFFSKPDSMAVSVKNLGNGFARPFGTVNVKNMFGGQAANYEVNNTIPKGAILPDSSRTFTNPIDKINLPGRYSAVAAIAYGDGGEVVVYKSSFWYLPVWTLIILALVLLVAIYFARRFYKNKFKRSTKHRF